MKSTAKEGTAVKDDHGPLRVQHALDAPGGPREQSADGRRAGARRGDQHHRRADRIGRLGPYLSRRHGRILTMSGAPIPPRPIIASGAARQGGQSEGTTEAPAG
jgi:hypothetical protein